MVSAPGLLARQQRIVMMKPWMVRIVLCTAICCLCLITLSFGMRKHSTVSKTNFNGSSVSEDIPIKTTATICTSRYPSWKTLNATYFRSQGGEDRHLLELFFHGLCGGTYVELGGLDGVTISNSHLFHTVYEWKGVLMELAPSNYEKLVRNRPNELVPPIHAAVCNSEQTFHYIEENEKFWGTTAGIWEFMSESFRQTWWKSVRFEDLMAIQCTPLRQLFQTYTPEIHFFDFLSLDVEGAELEALQSIDYELVSFGVILVEADRHNRRKNFSMLTFLERHGYRFLEEWERSYWFVHKDFDRIYQHTIIADE